MTTVRRIVCAALLVCTCNAAMAAQPSKAEKKALASTIDQISYSLEVTGTDTLDPDLWISTRPFLKTGWEDLFARAKVDKASGAVTYQLYFMFSTYGEALRPARLTFEMPEGLGETTLNRVHFEPNCSRHGCRIYEEAIATFTRAQFDAVAAAAVDGDPKVWKMKVFGDSMTGQETNLLASEIAGLLVAVERELARLKAM